ncbi:DMT family transporter [Microbulbifer bruguierae]|uniref:DMT family transporter n=1 Tax=Microbulbifer bruguierae TaxID=3029061 RepID=A0ABY8NGC7_9GAMM|nr:DMT family transporter [Microbulbifer bruguierae]WGL16787.1 DMT family transporter [Microbulbifer bruguierae]
MLTPPSPSTPLWHNGYVLAFGSAALFSIKAIFIKLAYRYGVDVDTFILLRMSLALPFYLAIIFTLHRSDHWQPVTQRTLLQVVVLGLCSYYLASYLDLQGLRYISANFERLIIYLYPTLVLFLGWAFLGRRISMRQSLCILCAYGGILLIFWQDQGFTTGVATPGWVNLSPLSWGALLTFGSALSFAIYVAFSENVIRTLGSRQFTALAMIAASAAIALHVLTRGDLSRLQQPWPVYGYALTVAFVCTVMPSLMMSAAIQKIGSATTGAIGTTGPIVTLLSAAWVLGEPFGVMHLIGMGVIIASLLMMKKPAAKTAAPMVEEGKDDAGGVKGEARTGQDLASASKD